MTNSLTRSSTADFVRATAVAALAVVQVIVSGLGGAGLVGEPVGVVARDYDTPLLAANWTFSIWGVIYASFLAYAVYQLLPGQRRREVHRGTGWWLAASAVLNPGWVLAFSARLVPLAELFIVGLLVCLAVVLARLSRMPADGVTERVVFRGTLALYTGWVSLATVLGTAATGVWAGLPGQGRVAVVAAVVALLAVAVIVSWVVAAGTAVVGFTVAAVWALAGITLNGPPLSVAVAAVTAIMIVLAAVVRLLITTGDLPRAAWG